VRVLVAGGRGFIGSHAVNSLAADADHTTGILEHDDDVGAVCAAGWDALVWAAGARRATVEENRAEHVTAPLAAIAATRDLKKVVYVSSGETYGWQDVPFSEDMPQLGTSPYALAKIEGERDMTAACATRGIALTILRLSVVYGPGQRGSMFVPSLVHALATGARFPMTRGEQTRDFIHVGDVATAIIAAVDGKPGVYNIGSGTEVALRVLATDIAARFGADARARLDIGSLPYRENEQMRYVLDATRAAADIAWRPYIALAAGLDQVVFAARAAG
jgi:nucleoside-diphosphate-sugar epimerase